MNWLTDSNVQTAVTYGIVFIGGIFVKSKMMLPTRTNSDTIDTLMKDYAAIKELYNAKCDEVKRKNEQLLQVGKDLLELQGRVRSYENFLRSRAASDHLLMQLHPIMTAIATHLDIPYNKPHTEGAQAAHSQADKTK